MSVLRLSTEEKIDLTILIVSAKADILLKTDLATDSDKIRYVRLTKLLARIDWMEPKPKGDLLCPGCDCWQPEEQEQEPDYGLGLAPGRDEHDVTL